MRKKYSPFHIRFVQPQQVEELLYILAEATSSLSDQEVMAKAQDWNCGLAYQKNPVEQFSILRLLTLIQGESRDLSEKGRQLVQILAHNPNLSAEIFHLLFYTSWNTDLPTEKCSSWSYRCLCNILWNRMSTPIVSEALASQLNDEIEASFSDAAPSVGPDTVRATSAWLRRLNPPCLESNGKPTFERRSFCSPELLLLATDFIYRESKISYASNVLLTDDRRNDICRLCLLKEESFDMILELSLSQFDFFRRGIGGGWGVYLNLERQPELPDLYS